MKNEKEAMQGEPSLSSKPQQPEQSSSCSKATVYLGWLKAIASIGLARSIYMQKIK